MLCKFHYFVFALLCGTLVADNIELGEKVYNDVLISGITKDKIYFIQAGKVNTDKPLNDVTKLKIESFPEFNRAEDLVALAQYAQAMKQYLEAYKNVKIIKSAWQTAEIDYLEKGQNILSETCGANAKSQWIKDLIKIRYAKAKALDSGEIPQANQEIEKDKDSATSPSVNDSDACSECRGKGKVKCSKCNGSGKIKCSHTVNVNGREEYHAHHYETCPTCKGQGKLVEYYYVKIAGRHVGTKYVPGYYDKRTRKVPCTNHQCRPYPKDPRIFVVWMCPFCATSTYPGYVDCKDCDKGRCTCPKCGGTGKIAANPQNGVTVSAGDKNTSNSPQADSASK